ncbi:o-spanin [Escherichia phage Sciku]|nr:o-spanin [Escherichia phage Shashou]QEG06882.1 o-spanin [Escherichia phage Sciku]QEG06955.1 o-spanin [Escherichia phage Snoke]
MKSLSTLKRLAAACALSTMLASCSSPTPLPTPIPSPDTTMMQPPCKLAPPSSDADEDLAIDVQNAECVRQLRLKVFMLQDYVRNILE